MEFFHLLKASQKSGKKDAVIWFTAKSAARANLQLDVALEDAEIETGRGKDYAKPIRTDMPVVDDLPEEGVIDYTWCERYTLADDQRTWNVIPGAASQSETAIAPDSATSDENKPVAAVTATDTADMVVREGGFTPRHTVADGAPGVLALATRELGTGGYFDGTSPSRAHEGTYDPEVRKRLAAVTEQLLSL